MSTPTTPGAAAPGAPAAKPGVQAPGQAAPPPAVDHAAEMAKLESARRAIELKERQHVVERRKFSEQRDTEKKTWGEKLSRLEVLEKAQREAQLNPEAHAQAIWGDKWYEKLVETKLNGGVPTAGVLASEIAKVEEKLRKELADRDAKQLEQSAEGRKQADAATRRQFQSSMETFVEANGKEYPVFKRLGSSAQVAAVLAQRIEAEYNRTERRDETSGELLMPGKILTSKEAADLLEADILGLAEEAAAHEKYQPKLREKLQPPKQAPPAPGASNQQRRTLSNDLTGSTPSGRTPPTTDAERRDKALAARNAAVASKVPRP